jgi:predicted enzyme related to lactoylglutathione lyase
MTWAEVNTRQGDQAHPFYAALLGLEAQKLEGLDYWVMRRDKGVCGVMQMDEKWPENIPNHWMPYFAVNDADAAVAAATANGGKVYQGPFDTPYGRVAVLGDPSGAVFSVVKLPDQS